MLLLANTHYSVSSSNPLIPNGSPRLPSPHLLGSFTGPPGRQDAQPHVVGVQFRAAVPAGHRGVQVVAAAVGEDGGGCVDGPLVAPGAQGLQHDAQLAASLGELVVVARRVLAVAAPLDDA